DGVRAVATQMAAQLDIPALDRAALEQTSAETILAAQGAITAAGTRATGRPDIEALSTLLSRGVRLPWAPWADGDVVTEEPMRAAMAKAEAGGAAYAYDFRWAPSAGPLAGLAFHCLDVPFFFDALGEPGVTEAAGPAPPAALAADMHGALVRFVTGGDPGWE